jgi:hypothetical protein
LDRNAIYNNRRAGAARRFRIIAVDLCPCIRMLQ